MILVLGGTGEGRLLAEALLERGHDCLLSLAGRTTAPLTAGPVRTGGFGGVEGLVDHLRTHPVEAVVDATHPFAATMTRHAFEACARTGTPLLRLARPGWEDHRLAGDWEWVDDHQAAARAAARYPGRVLLTVGRQHTPDYVPALAERQVVARVAEPVESPLPGHWRQLVARGPFRLHDELELLDDVDVLVTKNSGGGATAAKLEAAARLGLPVVMVHRPEVPAGESVVGSVEEALAWLSRPSARPSPAT